jgi:nucleotide-binding universal stress UspA family protein
MYRHILVGLDGSLLAESVLPYVEALAEKFGSRVTLLRATTPAATIAIQEAAGDVGPLIVPALDPNKLAEDERKEADAYLAQVARRFETRGVAVDLAGPESPSDEAILEAATSLGVDLIAMTTHGRGGLERLVLGSVAEAVLHRAPCPLLLVRATGDKGPTKRT